ncbi:MAG TPA: hypothetical protein VGN76_14830 [Gemmatimonadales bacterium]|jgi:hypothetical protein|nr:hypothetical protein [Gemmatimonadales bacterium]
MLRTLLGVIVLLALPALLNAQAPGKSNGGQSGPAFSHGIATQVQGDVAVPDEPNGPNHQDGLDEGDGQNNDGDMEQEGIDEHDGVNNEVEDQAGHDDGGQDEGSTPATAQSRIGRHKP